MNVNGRLFYRDAWAQKDGYLWSETFAQTRYRKVLGVIWGSSATDPTATDDGV